MIYELDDEQKTDNKQITDKDPVELKCYRTYDIERVLVQQKSKERKTQDKPKSVTWKNVVKLPDVIVSLFGLMITSSAWDWYGPSLEQFLSNKFGLDSTKCGLVFMAVGASYMITSPFCGMLLDRKISGFKVQVFGIFLIFLCYFFIGPIPPIENISSVYLTVAALAVQGIGSACSYLGKMFLYVLLSYLQF